MRCGNEPSHVASPPSAHDTAHKTSPRTFYAHHSAAISAAAAAHESLILESAATGLSSALLATP
jgi:hypothetical protein